MRTSNAELVTIISVLYRSDTACRKGFYEKERRNDCRPLLDLLRQARSLPLLLSQKQSLPSQELLPSFPCLSSFSSWKQPFRLHSHLDQPVRHLTLQGTIFVFTCAVGNLESACMHRRRLPWHCSFTHQDIGINAWIEVCTTG